MGPLLNPAIMLQMLQELPRRTKSSPKIKQFLHDLLSSKFDGVVDTDESTRSIASTDNSIWQVLPEVVISPKSPASVEHIVKLLSAKTYQSISVTPRGGGTSTAGQSLTDSIVLDCKRYLYNILEYDEKTRQVHVECGAVLQQVNGVLEEFGVMIGPTVATASRATIGGMIGNDSAGKGSQVYGKMSDCVVSLHTIIRGGETFRDDSKLAETIKNACDNARPHFERYWPSLPRFVSGYNLPMAWDGKTFDSNRIFCGSEGTLGITTSAIMQCVPIPKNQHLILFCFDSFDHALRCGATLAKHQPTAIETVDEMVLHTVRCDASWKTLSQLLEDSKDDTDAILFVECDSKNVQTILDESKGYKPLLTKRIVSKEERDIAWSFRSRSVGLLSSLKGKQRPVPFVEDCAVPPEKLADFIQEFKKLLTKHNLEAGMFGHVDAGVMHVRPALDMQNEDERKLVRVLTEEVASLVHSFGGVLWGEHGKGFRSEFGPQIFGDVIWEQMCAIKSAFDPYNQFNPGKVAVPNDSFSLATLESPTRGEQDENSPVLSILSNATNCDGNSECQSSSHTSSMCPTYRATDDPTQSPRGRADVLRYWLHRLEKEPRLKKSSFIRRLLNSGNTDDFNHEVKQVLDSCLSCKACASNCPLQIDIPSMRSQFYNLYFGRYLRPMRDLLWFHMERTLPIQRFLPSRFFASLLGICDVPKPSNTFRKTIRTSTPEQIARDKPDVVLLQDSFTTYFRPAPCIAMVKILEHLGHKVCILPLRACGKALHVRGALDAFYKTANKNIQWLSPVYDAQIPIIGIDPAATLLWRDEYPNNPIEVLLPQEWLIKQDLSSITLKKSWRLFAHCIEKATALDSSEQWKQLFAKMQGSVEIVATSCCGMGGLFGHQRENKQVSQDIWEMHWKKEHPKDLNALTTGYSCFSQAKRFAEITMLHPLEAIANSINPIR